MLDQTTQTLWRLSISALLSKTPCRMCVCCLLCARHQRLVHGMHNQTVVRFYSAAVIAVVITAAQATQSRGQGSPAICQSETPP